MKERPILFSAPMVRALLAGTKTQTRRVLTPQSQPWREHYMEGGASPSDWKAECGDDGDPRMWWWHSGAAASDRIGRCPYGVPGDRLWVRETWRVFGGPEYEYQRDPRSVQFRADETAFEQKEWRPSIFLPRWASRITLEVTEVRVQRVQDISEEDARAEGARCLDAASGREAVLGDGSYRDHFKALWDSINGKRRTWDVATEEWTTTNDYDWNHNPWVWCVSFKRVTP